MKRPRRATVRPTLAHGIMVLAGLVTFVLVAATLRDRSATVEVLVASAAIDAGTPLDAAPVATVAIDAGSPLLPSFVTAEHGRAEAALGRTLRAGEPVLLADLVPEGTGAGPRTVALPVERLVLDGLGLRTGDRVDVMGVETDGTARFVAVDVGVARLPGESALGLGRSVETATTWLTLSVTDQQALALAAASGRGEVVVARSTGATPIGQPAMPAASAPVDTAEAADGVAGRTGRPDAGSVADEPGDAASSSAQAGGGAGR